MLLDHGGNIGNNKSIDFSSNINPLGPSKLVKDELARRVGDVVRYPDPECNEARIAISRYLGIDKDNIIVGNGSNELLHILPRAIGISCALIYQPTFSEYELSVRLSGARTRPILAKGEDDFCIDIKRIVKEAPPSGLVVLCNPNNPTGNIIKKNELMDLAFECKKRKTYLFIDEAFIEFAKGAGELTLAKEAGRNRYLLVLRSLTKFFSLPGLRAGYMVAHRGIIGKMKLLQPTWSVNSFSQAIISKCLSDSAFIKKSKNFIMKERRRVFDCLKAIKAIRPFEPGANFILCEILDKKMNSASLQRRLIKSGIVIRDCSNFKGLGSKFFRIAIRIKKENNHLLDRLEKIFR